MTLKTESTDVSMGSVQNWPALSKAFKIFERNSVKPESSTKYVKVSTVGTQTTTSVLPLTQSQSTATMIVLMIIILTYMANKLLGSLCLVHKDHSLANSSCVVANVYIEEKGWDEYKVYKISDPSGNNNLLRCLK